VDACRGRVSCVLGGRARGGGEEEEEGGGEECAAPSRRVILSNFGYNRAFIKSSVESSSFYSEERVKRELSSRVYFKRSPFFTPKSEFLLLYRRYRR
jgi:hypothetical protein